MSIQKQLIYHDLARYYDYIYHEKNYLEEVDFIDKVINKYKKTAGNQLLDIGCATGNHLKYLSKNYNCFGLDKNDQLLEVAKKKKVKAELICGDMIDFKINHKFDIIICLFATISYITKTKDLVLAINNISSHLKKGGIFIVDPWFSKDKFRPGNVYSTHYEDTNLHIDRMTCSKIKGNISVTDENYLIGEKNIGVKHYVDRHELMLLNKDTFTKILTDAGFKGIFLEEGMLKNRGLFINTKL